MIIATWRQFGIIMLKMDIINNVWIINVCVWFKETELTPLLHSLKFVVLFIPYDLIDSLIFLSRCFNVSLFSLLVLILYLCFSDYLICYINLCNIEVTVAIQYSCWFVLFMSYNVNQIFLYKEVENIVIYFLPVFHFCIL